MHLPDNYFLSFRMRGTTCYFDSRSPIIESCQTFKVSDEHDWDPTADMFISVSASDSCDVYECFHEFDLLQGSLTHMISQIRTSDRHYGVDASLVS